MPCSLHNGFIFGVKTVTKSLSSYNVMLQAFIFLIKMELESVRGVGASRIEVSIVWL